MLELLYISKSDFWAGKNFPRKYLNPIPLWPFAFSMVRGVFFHFNPKMTKIVPIPSKTVQN